MQLLSSGEGHQMQFLQQVMRHDMQKPLPGIGIKKKIKKDQKENKKGSKRK